MPAPNQRRARVLGPPRHCKPGTTRRRLQEGPAGSELKMPSSAPREATFLSRWQIPAACNFTHFQQLTLHSALLLPAFLKVFVKEISVSITL